MQVNSINPIKQINTSPKFTSRATFKNTEPTSDTFESQRVDSCKKSNILNIIGGALIIGLSAALIYKHQGLNKSKAQVEALEKGKKELIEAKASAEEALKKAKEDSEQKISELEDKVGKLETSKQALEYLEQEKIDESFNSIIAIENTRKGFGRTAGYENIKLQLLEKVILPIEKKQEPPKILLFYGPKGCGKTTFSSSIEEEASCNTFYIFINSKENFTKIKETIEKAEKKYNENNKYAIIAVSSSKEIDVNTISTINELLKDKHSTVVLKTNHNQVNSDLVKGMSLEQIYIGPPSESDIEKILKFYISTYTNKTINYVELVNTLRGKTKDAEFSNAKIVDEILNFVAKNKAESGKQLEQFDFVELFNNLEPDISKEVIDSYKK